MLLEHQKLATGYEGPMIMSKKRADKHQLKCLSASGMERNDLRLHS